MEVKIYFDTEKESVEDLKRLVVALQDLITKREKLISQGNSNNGKQQTIENQTSVAGQTSGGGRVIPYEDMSGVLSKIVSGRKY